MGKCAVLGASALTVAGLLLLLILVQVVALGRFDAVDPGSPLFAGTCDL